MTLLKLFNEALRELPSVSERLENFIRYQEWPKEKSKQAIEIIQQLKKADLVKTVKGLSYTGVALFPLTITLSPSECGISNSKTFKPENIGQADQYIEDLLTDINRISEDVRFSFGGHRYCDSVKCTFDISWTF